MKNNTNDNRRTNENKAKAKEFYNLMINDLEFNSVYYEIPEDLELIETKNSVVLKHKNTGISVEKDIKAQVSNGLFEVNYQTASEVVNEMYHELSALLDADQNIDSTNIEQELQNYIEAFVKNDERLSPYFDSLLDSDIAEIVSKQLSLATDMDLTNISEDEKNKLNQPILDKIVDLKTAVYNSNIRYYKREIKKRVEEVLNERLVKHTVFKDSYITVNSELSIDDGKILIKYEPTIFLPYPEDLEFSYNDSYTYRVFDILDFKLDDDLPKCTERLVKKLDRDLEKWAENSRITIAWFSFWSDSSPKSNFVQQAISYFYYKPELTLQEYIEYLVHRSRRVDMEEKIQRIEQESKNLESKYRNLVCAFFRTKSEKDFYIKANLMYDYFYEQGGVDPDYYRLEEL